MCCYFGDMFSIFAKCAPMLSRIHARKSSVSLIPFFQVPHYSFCILCTPCFVFDRIYAFLIVFNLKLFSPCVMQEKPHLFQFVPNEKQVRKSLYSDYLFWYICTCFKAMLPLQIKEANKLLKTIPQNSGCKRVEGVPVFSAQNLDIAIATMDGIKWCVLAAVFIFAY